MSNDQTNYHWIEWHTTAKKIYSNTIKQTNKENAFSHSQSIKSWSYRIFIDQFQSNKTYQQYQHKEYCVKNCNTQLCTDLIAECLKK